MIAKKTTPGSLSFGLAALVSGVIGQLLLETNRIIPAVVFYGLAVGGILVALRRQPGPEVEFSSPPPLEGGKWLRRGLAALGAGVVAGGLAFWLFSSRYPQAIPWLLHLVSLGLFVLSAIFMDRAGREQPSRVAAQSDWAAAHSEARQAAEQDQPWSWIEIGVFLAILALAAFMRLYRFDQIPFGLWYDEADNGLNALRILHEPGYLPVFIESTNLPAHYILLIALSFRILGVSALSIRAVSVLFGLATVPAAYLAGRELFNRKMGLVLAFLLAVSRWDVNWSRIGMHGVTVPFFELLAIGLLLRAIRRQRLLDYALAGLSLGLGLSFYVPLRLLPVVAGLFLLVLWLARKDFLRSSWRGLLLLGLGVLIVSVPITKFAATRPKLFFSRMQVTSIFEGKTPAEAWEAVARTSRDHLLMFNDHGDGNGRHNLVGAPMLDPLSGALLVLGVSLCLWRIRRPGSFLLLAWLLLMLAPGVFSLDFESPQSLRAIGSMPAAYLIAAVPLYGLWREWDRFGAQRRLIPFFLPLILALCAIGYLNYHVYFDLQAVSFESWSAFSAPETITGKILAETGDQVDNYVSVLYANTPTLQFLAPEAGNYHVLQTHESLPLSLDGTKTNVFILDGDRAPAYLQLKQYFPDAAFKEYRSPDGRVVLYEAILAPEDVAATRGLIASYYPDADWTQKPSLVRKETNFDFDWQDGAPLPDPFGVEWNGVLYAPTYGDYRLIVRSPAPAELFLDQVQVGLTGEGEQTAEVGLAQGTHTFRLRTLGKAGHFALTWQPPSGGEAPLPLSSLLVPPVTNNGLLARYYPNANWEGPPALARIDAWIHFYVQEIPLPRPYTVEWSGEINLTEPGHYHFGLESIDESALYVDERQIVDARQPNQYQDGEIDLPVGRHSLRLRFTDRTGSTHVNLYWTVPGGEQAIIPSEVLFPPQGDPALLAPLVKSTPTQPVAPPQPAAPPQPENPSGASTITLHPTRVSDRIPDLPEIQAVLLWQSGECGSGPGQLQNPTGVHADQQGNVWVADTGNRRLVEFDPQGRFVRDLGKTGDGVGPLLAPYDVLVEPDGGLLALDSETPDILKRFSPAGDLRAVFGASLGAYNPRGFAVDDAGSIYLADTGGGRLLRLAPGGSILAEWVFAAQGETSSQPVSVALSAQGVVYATDAVGGMIVGLFPGGKSLAWAAAASGSTVAGLHVAVGPQNDVFVTDPEGKRVTLFTARGQPLGQIRFANDQAEQSGKPVGITIRPDGVLVVTDYDLCQVRAYRLPGQ